MTISTVRRLAADILNVGRLRVKFSPDGLKEAEGALTRADVKGLIDKGIITKAKVKGRASTSKKKRRGRGSRKGSFADKKKNWMIKVRAQRKFLALLIELGALDKKNKRSLYGKVKSGIFRNKRAMLLYLKDNGFVSRDYEMPKPKRSEKKSKKTVKATSKAEVGKKEPAEEKPAKKEPAEAKTTQRKKEKETKTERKKGERK